MTTDEDSSDEDDSIEEEDSFGDTEEDDYVPEPWSTRPAGFVERRRHSPHTNSHYFNVMSQRALSFAPRRRLSKPGRGRFGRNNALVSVDVIDPHMAIVVEDISKVRRVMAVNKHAFRAALDSNRHGDVRGRWKSTHEDRMTYALFTAHSYNIRRPKEIDIASVGTVDAHRFLGFVEQTAQFYMRVYKAVDAWRTIYLAERSNYIPSYKATLATVMTIGYTLGKLIEFLGHEEKKHLMVNVLRESLYNHGLNLVTMVYVLRLAMKSAWMVVRWLSEQTERLCIVDDVYAKEIGVCLNYKPTYPEVCSLQEKSFHELMHATSDDIIDRQWIIDWLARNMEASAHFMPVAGNRSDSVSATHEPMCVVPVKKVRDRAVGISGPMIKLVSIMDHHNIEIKGPPTAYMLYTNATRTMIPVIECIQSFCGRSSVNMPHEIVSVQFDNGVVRCKHVPHSTLSLPSIQVKRMHGQVEFMCVPVSPEHQPEYIGIVPLDSIVGAGIVCRAQKFRREDGRQCSIEMFHRDDGAEPTFDVEKSIPLCDKGVVACSLTLCRKEPIEINIDSHVYQFIADRRVFSCSSLGVCLRDRNEQTHTDFYYGRYSIGKFKNRYLLPTKLSMAYQGMLVDTSSGKRVCGACLIIEASVWFRVNDEDQTKTVSAHIVDVELVVNDNRVLFNNH